MPGASDLIDRVADESKMNGTAASADRARILKWLQEAADRVCSDASIPVTSEASVVLTAGDPTYVLDASPFPTDMVALLDVSVTDSAVTSAPVNYVTPHEMQGMRQGGTSITNGTPQVYSGDWPNIVVWPPPAAGTTLSITYLANAPTLTDASTALVFVSVSGLWGCVFELAMMRALQFKGQGEAAKDRFGAYKSNLRDVRRWVGSAMARQGPQRPTLHSRVYSPSQDTGVF